MNSFGLPLGLALLSALSLPALSGPVDDAVPPSGFSLASVSASRSYGVLLAAPEAGCAPVRYRVESATGGYLGQSGPVGPGGVALVRVGAGFATGAHELQIATLGCVAPPAQTRQVSFRKASPDHGWRAARALARGKSD